MLFARLIASLWSRKLGWMNVTDSVGDGQRAGYHGYYMGMGTGD